jgi:Fe-S-cluster-containing dehydrogenase component
MGQRISRRSFLKGGLAAAAGVAASSIPATKALATPGESKQLATLIDISKCIGCEACVEACSEVNAEKYPDPQKPFPKMYPKRVPVEDWSEKQDVNDRLTPYNWLFIQHAEVEIDGEETEVTIPRRCMHCTNPPCVKLCPWGAAQQLENGISRIDSDICLGGSKCRKVCPWNIPQRQTGTGLYLDILPSMAGNGVMYKCDRCYKRVAEGKMPACIEACPEDVQTIGPRQDIIKKAHALAKEINGYIYGENENGGTNTIYVSPVPFEKLNAAIETGKGKPHLKPVKDTMARANNLATAMLVAPFAGIAAAVGKYYKLSKNKENASHESQS